MTVLCRQLLPGQGKHGAVAVAARQRLVPHLKQDRELLPEAIAESSQGCRCFCLPGNAKQSDESHVGSPPKLQDFREEWAGIWFLERRA